jgi:hypothetical protein
MKDINPYMAGYKGSKIICECLLAEPTELACKEIGVSESVQ